MQVKPFSQACENNKQPILQVLSRYLQDGNTVLEIGSGTGQHAVYFSQHLPGLSWQPTDLEMNLAGINQWCDEAAQSNLLKPLVLDIDGNWPQQRYDAVFSANTAHIVSWQQVQTLFSQIEDVLAEDGFFILYGPFNYDGAYTSESNAKFDQWLKVRDVHSGIRDFEAVNDLANAAGLKLVEDCAMPANNRTLVWQRLVL